MDNNIENEVFKIFHKQKVMTKKELITILNCTGRTIQRRLSKWQALTCYNQNSKYYTLRSIPSFDVHGIWHYCGISFSKYGNLKNTVVQVITYSQAGLSGHELGEVLRLSPRSFLSPFRDNPNLLRKKINNRYIYFSSNKKDYQKQEINRLKQEMNNEMLPSDAEAVQILVEVIKHPGWSYDDIAYSLQNKGRIISPNSIQQLFIHHDLVKKKTK